MIKEIYSFDLYEEFIKDYANDSIYADPHFAFDNGNLYNSLSKNNRKAYIVSEGETVSGLFVWMILPDEKYIEMLIGLSNEESSIQEMLTFIENEYKGYQLDFVVNPQHNLFCNLLQSKNAMFEEEQQWMVTYCYEKNEPYDIWVDNEFRDRGYEQALLQAAINMNKPKEMMVLVDINNFDEIETFKSVGFVPVIGTNSVYATYKS